MINNVPSIFGSFPTLFDKRMDDAFDELLNYRGINAEDIEGAKKIYIDLPGVKKEDVKISAENNSLSVQAERKGFIKSTYNRSYSLAQNFDTDHVSAELIDGVLIITLPLKNKKAAKAISVR